MCLNAEQQMFRDSVRSYLAHSYPFEKRQAVVASKEGYSTLLWQAFARELGLMGLGFPERLGGMGGSALDLLAVIQPMGEAGVVAPFIETVVLAGRLLQAGTGKVAADLAARIIAGEALVGCAFTEADTTTDYTRPATRLRRSHGSIILSGVKVVVQAAPFATDLLVSSTDEDGRLAILHLPAHTPGVTLRPCKTIDGRRAADIHFENVSLPPEALLPIAAPEAAMGHAIDATIAAFCAEAVGVLGMIVQDTVLYTRGRQQFGKPLSSFQVLQHRMADMKIALTLATAATYAATIRLEDASALRAAQVSAAKVAVARACRTIGNNGIQLHGGMGMSAELPLGHRVQRATVLARIYGSAGDHLLRLAASQAPDHA